MIHHRATGLYLTPHRTYRPDISRWLSRDPAGEFANGLGWAQDVNLYAYVGNSPLNFTVPSYRAGAR